MPQIIVRFYLLVLPAFIFFTSCRNADQKKTSTDEKKMADTAWHAPDSNQIPRNAEGDLIRYGKQLITNTAHYLGPKGKVLQISNGMNCQNCHIDAGRRSFGNNFSMVASSYPKFRERSGRMESIEFRVNDCMERSLNGKALDNSGKEMRAIVAYLKWVGKDVAKGTKIPDAAVEKLKFLDRPADTVKGKALYLAKCISCHGSNGQGVIKPDSGYLYPPLWGPHSFNVGAGLYRITRMAGYIKNNMPLGSTYKNPQLSAEEAWDISAYVLSQPRPAKDLRNDWPKLHTKPFDYPFGPYVTKFSEKQHKYGPFKPIITADSLYAAGLKNN